MTISPLNSPQTQSLYTAHGLSNDLPIIDLASFTVTKRIPPENRGPALKVARRRQDSVWSRTGFLRVRRQHLASGSPRA
ncbi:protein of unknown function [Candidatus Methylocalor cossyra]|uniref:Uncharacterized protein n=1 Tax=Candidatus Methylocalor cossyra TaxID=3108543 RepID=A0ABP1C4W1_9GAMM